VNGAHAIYRFLASVKLAVLTLGTLAATLGYATLFESWYGTTAVREYIYRAPGFAILLAFLGTNILCAALIRYPWKKRQTGFVITHAGLLVLLAGSLYSVRTSDEGQVGMLEGDVKGELVRTDDPVIRVWEVDPHTQQNLREIDLPFEPGAFGWGPGRPQPAGVVERVISTVTLGLASPAPATEQVLSKPGDPFRFVVKEHLPASSPAVVHVADPGGSPMARIRVRFKPPGAPMEQDAFSEDEQWFATETKFHRVVRSPMRGAPAQISFSSVDRPELVEDFLKPPATGPEGVARFRYPDRSGRIRVFDWSLEGQQGKSMSLPDSDLTVALTEVLPFPTQERALDRILGDDPVPIALFKIHRGGDEPVTHIAMANLPMVPPVLPSHESPGAPPKPPLASIHYMITPTLNDANGRRGAIDVLAGPGDKLVYRVFGRGKTAQGELRDAGAVTPRKSVLAFGGNPKMPMTIRFEVDDYMPAGAEKNVFVPIELPKGKKDDGIAACRVEMTVGDETKEFWLRRSITRLDSPPPKYVTFRDGFYAFAYDCDRKPLGFDLKLDDFEVGFEPGTEQPTKFVSQVRLNDTSENIKDQPHTISMNHPLYHRGYTFYQSQYRPHFDAQEQPTGRFLSIFQVAINPGRPIIYAGCLLVVLGAFTQFYMRAGVFTDGGKRERERAAAKSTPAGPKTKEATPARPEETERL